MDSLALNKMFGRIKENAIKETEGMEEADFWDEESGGVGWIQNELVFIAELYSIIQPNGYGYLMRELEELNKINLVQGAFLFLLQNINPFYLLVLYNGVMNDGTHNEFFWSCINKHRNEQMLDDEEIKQLERIL